MLAVAVSDVLEAKPIMQVSDSLTFIAEVVLQACLRRAYEALIVKHGYPLAVNGERLNADNCGVAIIGYGKLGGIELGYNSDLDLVFLHRLAQNGYSDGEVPISGLKFATRLVQKLMNYLTAQTRDGRVYELDTRLRPSGNAGVMVVSLAAFLHYQNDQAWVWEHQALVRARGICGDSEALSSFEQIRAQVLTSAQDERQLQTQICDMREKMRAHLANNDSNQFHLKQDVGGLVDIEFIAQYAVLRYANLYPALSQWSDNIRIFERLEELGIWDNVTCQTLKTAYLRLRKAVHKQALAEQSVLVLATDWVELRADVDAIWQRIFIQGEN